MKQIYLTVLLIALLSTPGISMPIPSEPAQSPTAPAYSGGAPSIQTVDHEENIVFVKFMCATAGVVMMLDDSPTNDLYGGFLVGMVAISFLFN